jgi:hypothetical protein
LHKLKNKLIQTGPKLIYDLKEFEFSLVNGVL